MSPVQMISNFGIHFSRTEHVRELKFTGQWCNIWVCSFNSEFGSTRPFDRGVIWADHKDLNKPHSVQNKHKEKLKNNEKKMNNKF
jgi:hypothetical protein